MSDCIYIKRNSDWDWDEKLKYGYVHRKDGDENLINRLCDSREEHSELSKFTDIYAFEKTKDYKLACYDEIDKIFSLFAKDTNNVIKYEEKYNITLPLLRKLNEHLVQSNTKQSNEFIYETGILLLKQIMEVEFPLLGLKLVKIYTEEEINEINKSSRKQTREKTKNEKKYDSLMDILKIERNKKSKVIKEIQKEERKWFKREYQEKAIKYGLEQLQEFSKLYLELATGAGKSYIVYNILNQIRPDTIVIFSPRKEINKQNVSAKYLSLLDVEYQVYDCSTDGNFDKFKENCKKLNKKMIIVATPQGANQKVYNIIHEYELTNVFIWFDEAHHTVQNWVEKLDNRYINFFMTDTNMISHRIFTSASPKIQHVQQYPNIFGELYSPIKVSKLILLNWLCHINPLIFKMNNDNVDICNYILQHFSKYTCIHGFSFHNRQNSACALFLEHYKRYTQQETDIKPFLLVDNYKNKILEDVVVDYNYRSINTYQETPNSIGYVVQQYSMGYDFNKIDYICFSDPKMSYQDIIQCIGRGLRPDGLGENGSNLNKTLTIMLPVFMEQDIDTDFNRIEGVLRYLVYDIDYPYNDIITNFESCGNSHKKLLGKKYNGKENMDGVLLDLLRGGKYSVWKSKDFVNILKNRNIHNREVYNEFIKKRPELNLPEIPGVCFPYFTWEQTYEESPYYSRDVCKQKIAEIKDENDDLDLDEEDEPEVVLNSIDNKIPPQCLFKFYGGHSNNEYY